MNNKFGRDGRYPGERFRREGGRESFPRPTDEDRTVRSPDQEFETSGPYRQPREPYDETYSSQRDRSYGLPGNYAPDYGRDPNRRYNFDGIYAPSYGTGGTGEGWSSDARGGYAGRGPKGYTRSDERIREDVCERLSWSDEVDATEIIVRVQSGEVTLEGRVQTRHMKRLAEDLSEEVQGVVDIHNTLRVSQGLLTEIKEKLTGEADGGHYANTGTKTQSEGSPIRNGAP